MHIDRLSPFALALGLFLATTVCGQPPTFEWQTVSAASQGMSQEKLDALRAVIETKKTKALLVIRNDKIVYEWYSADHGPTVKHGTASLAKALVGGLSLAVAMTDGKISLDDPAAKFVPEWKTDQGKSQIIVRHLGSHTSGMSDSTTTGVKHEDQPDWMGDFWKRLDPPNDPFSIARDKTPMLFAPGEKLQYSNPGIGMLTYCVTAAIKDSAHKDVRTLLRERVMRPIGVPDGEWSCGYGKTYTVDGLPLVGTDPVQRVPQQRRSGPAPGQ
jgi:CubicO group peptidase (beta-lactamase class C family)